MRDRLVTAAGALLALTVVYAMFFQQGDPAQSARPLSTETGPEGYSAVRAWLEHSGVRVVSLTQRYDRLEEPGGRSEGDAQALPRSGNVLITAVPHRLVARTGETMALHRWIRAGNTLLVFAALDETPEWSADPATDWRPQLTRLTGLAFEIYRESGGGQDPLAKRTRPSPAPANLVAGGDRVEFRPVGEHPLMSGVDRLIARSDRDSAILYALQTAPLVRLAVESTTGVDAAWQQRWQDGQIIVFASAAVLSNRNVAEGDAGRFIANVLRYHASGGAVIFDDMHQGLSTLYDPAAFFADSRLHATAAFLIAAWLAWLLGSSNRLAPPAARSAPRHGDFLAAAGGLLARRLDRREAGLLLLEDWFDEIRRKHGLSADRTPPWHAIAATPALHAETRDALRRAYERLREGRPVDLLGLHNTLREAREAVG